MVLARVAAAAPHPLAPRCWPANADPRGMGLGGGRRHDPDFDAPRRTAWATPALAATAGTVVLLHPSHFSWRFNGGSKVGVSVLTVSEMPQAPVPHASSYEDRSTEREDRSALQGQRDEATPVHDACVSSLWSHRRTGQHCPARPRMPCSCVD